MTSVFPEDSDRAGIESLQKERLRTLLETVIDRNEFWKVRFEAAGLSERDVQGIDSLDALARLPLTTKHDLVADQTAHPPYGTNLTRGEHEPLDSALPNRFTRLHQTSGTTTGRPMRWLDTPRNWNWFLECWEQIYRIVGVTSDDRFCFPFSFGPFIGFWAAFEGACQLNQLCLAGGGMSSQARVQLIEDNSATIICCTPTYALRMAEVAESEGRSLADSPVRMLIVAGEPGGSLPAVRDRIESAWGARVFDHWGMTEIGALAVECQEGRGGLHVLETECIAEILDPDDGQPVESDGNGRRHGELVLTNLGRLDSPLIRYRTGDLVTVDPEPCPCGRRLLRVDGGILGRVDDMITIRGNNVFPSSIEAIIREFPDVCEFRIDVDTVRAMQRVRTQLEPANDLPEDGATQLLEEIGGRIKDRLNFNAELSLVEPNSLPRFELKGRRFFRASGTEDRSE